MGSGLGRVTTAEKRELSAHTLCCCELPRGSGRGRKEARGLEIGDCMLENRCLAGWEVGVSVLA